MKAVDLVRAGYEAYARRDFPAIFALLDDEFEVIQTEELPWGGRYRGLPDARIFFGKLSENLDAAPEIDEYIEAGDDVAAVGHLKGYVLQSGESFRIRIVHVWTVRDGKAVRFQAFIDTPAMLKLLGLS